MPQQDTIVAIATPPGRGGVGIVRVCGAGARALAEAVMGKLPPPRYAALACFRDAARRPIDHGIALFFPAPHSFTGEDTIELHGHGGPVVLDMLVKRCVELGARLARPGEFSERAFLNGKLCTIYFRRPESCCAYPIFTPDFRWTLADTLEGAAVCPIIYHVLDALTKVLESRL